MKQGDYAWLVWIALASLPLLGIGVTLVVYSIHRWIKVGYCDLFVGLNPVHKAKNLCINGFKSPKTRLYTQ
jgi:hypothetical protein